MRKIIFLLFMLVTSSNIMAQVLSEVVKYAWVRNLTNSTGYNNILSNCQSIKYDSSNVYVSCTCIPGYSIGPWNGNPNTPVNENFVFKITRLPAKNNGTLTTIGNGHTGVWTNGVSVFNVSDAQSYNNAGIWNRNAYFWEGSGFDNCLGHPAPNGEYHHHVNPQCLYDKTDSTHHSPIIGYAMDGYPIYGAYAYTDTNGTGPIKRMKSGYTIANPNATTRVNGPNVSTTYPLGCFMEDYAFTNAGDLDLRNGRNCRTPEYPNGTYAYFVTIDGNMNPAFPYTMYKNYYGIVQAGNTGPNGAHNTIPGTAVTYATLFAPTISIATNSTTVCAGTSVTFTATATKPGNSPVYQWKKNNVNAGTGISYTSNTLANGDVISCTITSNAYYLTSNTATSNSITMTVNANVTPSVSITPSSQTICAGTNVNFTATPNNGGALPVYQWKKNGNVVGTNSSLYSDNALVNTDVILCELTSNAACASQSTATSNSITMTVNANVTPSVSITSSSQTICTGTNVNFTATPNNGGALPVYQWKKNGNVLGTNSSAYSDNALANSDVVLCELTSNAACASPSNATSNSIAMTVSATVPPKSGAISGTRYNLCAAVGNFTYSVAAVSTATSYLWVAPANSTIISGQGTPSVVMTFASNFKAGTLSVTPSNGCGNGTVRTATLYSIPEKPATMLGSSTVCANQQNVAYSCATSTGATSYKWTVPTGSTIASGQGTNNILVNFGTIAGTIDVVAKNACGGSSKNSLAFNITCRTGSDLIGALQNDFVVVNPFNDKIILHAEEDINNVTATLYDVTGREILNWNNLSFSANEQMELSVKKNIQLGIYFLSIKNSNANFVVKLNHL